MQKIKKIKRITVIENADVYDITVEKNHNFFANGILVHNCFEIGMWPQTEAGESGWSFCNLSEINCKKIKTEEDFYAACKAAAIIGTIQAAYSEFPFLGNITEDIVKREALLGVSMTGMMDAFDIVFNPKIQRKGAKIVLETNEKIAKLLGINICARATCIKPSGTACTSIDTKIKTNKGIQTLEQIFKDYGFENSNSGDALLLNPNELTVYDEENKPQSVLGLYNNGEQLTYTIEFEDGNSYCFTAEHKLLTKDGYKTVDELTIDDDIISF